jgi:acyl-lipid omega-6 desaturase (Delta-12 desaturase)
VIDQSAFRQQTSCFQTPVLRCALSQIINSFGGFFAVCGAMYALLGVSYWLALALAPAAAGFLVRIFIIQHDCGHLAFFRARAANSILGFACSLLTLTPYASWRQQHAGHHGIWNDLDRRQSGADIYSSCLTLKEYEALSPQRRWWHRATRHWLVANVMLPPLIFLALYRVPFDTPKARWRERRSVYLTNLALAVEVGGLGLLLGFERVAIVQLPVMALASIAGVWLFSVQHRFEQTLWTRQGRWRWVDAALQGSSFLRLPPVLRWFTGSIGYHHVHHLNPRVPNYRLRECHDSIPALQRVLTLSFQDGLRALNFVLWDEGRNRMITFREVGDGYRDEAALTLQRQSSARSDETADQPSGTLQQHDCSAKAPDGLVWVKMTTRRGAQPNSREVCPVSEKVELRARKHLKAPSARPTYHPSGWCRDGEA